MADKKEPPAAAPAEAPPPEKKGLPTKMLGIVAGLMVAEAAGVFLFVKATGAHPQAAAAETIQGANEADLEASVEIPLIDEKFQNMQTGRVWIWDTSIVLKVRKRNEDYVNKLIEQKQAEIAEGVAMIFRRAPHSSLKEPGLETVNRQLTAYMNEVLGKDGEGKDRLERVVIPKCKGFPAD